MSDSKQLAARKYGNFWQGFLISLAAWSLDAELAIIIYSWLVFDRNRGPWSFWETVTRNLSGPLVLISAVLLAFFWLPVAVIVGFRARKKGFESTLLLMFFVFVIAPSAVGCIIGFVFYS